MTMNFADKTLIAEITAKMLLEDLPADRPWTLFLSLGVYGGALILVPRLLRRAG